MKLTEEKQAERFLTYYTSTVTWCRALHASQLFFALMLAIGSGSPKGLIGIEDFIGNLFGAGPVTDHKQFFIWAPILLSVFAIFSGAVYWRRIAYRNVWSTWIRSQNADAAKAARVDFDHDIHMLAGGSDATMSAGRFIRHLYCCIVAVSPAVAYWVVQQNIQYNKLSSNSEATLAAKAALQESGFMHWMLALIASVIVILIVVWDWRLSRIDLTASLNHQADVSVKSCWWK